MLEITGNIWDYHKDNNWIVITTNGDVRKDGAAVMGRGIALQAAQRFPKLPQEFGKLLQENGNQMCIFPLYRLITFPVKNHWYEKASLDLIWASAIDLALLTETPLRANPTTMFYMVRPGCGNGQLQWKDVKPLLTDVLSDNVCVVEMGAVEGGL
jgi:hypothetical protein